MTQCRWAASILVYHPTLAFKSCMPGLAFSSASLPDQPGSGSRTPPLSRQKFWSPGKGHEYNAVQTGSRAILSPSSSDLAVEACFSEQGWSGLSEALNLFQL